MKNYYSLLNVSHNASAEEIKRSFRQLALKFHPDRNPDPAAEVIFKEINEAYDVLSDPLKKQLYDQRLQNPLAEILTEPSQQPAHRDPAYRRRRPQKPSAPKIPEAIQLMMDYFKYVRWLSWIGLIFSMSIFLDYVLPYKHVDETIVGETIARDRRGGVAYVRLHTQSGKRIKIYPEQFVQLNGLQNYRVVYTMIFSSRMSISEISGDNKIVLAYLYHGIILFPIALLFTSALAIAFSKNIEFSFNSSLVSGVLSAVVWFLL